MWEKMGKIGHENFWTVHISRSGDRMNDRSAPMELGRVEPIGTTNFSIKNDKSPNARIALIGLD